MRWPPVSLISGTSYLSATSAIRRSSSGVVDAARHLRDDRERAVALDVGVHAVVDEARVALVDVLAFPDHREQRRQRRLAAGVLLAAGQRGEHRRHRSQPARADRLDQLRLGQRDRRHVVVRARILLDLAAAGPLDDLARPAPCTSRSPCRPASPSITVTRAASRRRRTRTRSPLDTPLQLQTCASSAISAAPCLGRRPPMSNSSSTRSSGSGRSRSNACVRYATLLMSPSRMAPTSRPLRTISFL